MRPAFCLTPTSDVGRFDQQGASVDEHPELEGSRPAVDAYEAPRVERVLTANDLAREILYAGTDTASLVDA